MRRAFERQSEWQQEPSPISPLKDAATTRWWKRASIEDDKGERQDEDAEEERKREKERDRRRYPRGATRRDHPRG